MMTANWPTSGISPGAPKLQSSEMVRTTIRAQPVMGLLKMNVSLPEAPKD